MMGMGGMGMGMGGSPLMTGLMAGGLGYLLGSNNANQQGSSQPQVLQVMPAPTYPQMPPPIPVPPTSTGNGTLAQLTLLGELHDSGVLTDEEFVREKNRILSR